MKKVSAILLMICMLLSCTHKPEQLPRLQVKGTALVNEFGDTVQFKGMSFGWNVLWPRFYNAGAVKHVVEDWNAEIVRAAVGVELRASEAQTKCYLDDPDFGKESACTVVDAAVANGVYVLVDWHAHGLHTAEAVEFFPASSENRTQKNGKFTGNSSKKLLTLPPPVIE